MLSKWLDNETAASWTAICNVIDAPAVSGGQAVIKGEYSQSIYNYIYATLTP